MLISEIFSSIEGEGIRTGYLCTFIRLVGCNLLCTYCDSLYSVKIQNKEQYQIMDIDQIINRCIQLKNKRITLTGGEPLIHKDVKKLIYRLIEEGFEVNIETNGSVPLTDYESCNVIITMDWKSPSSGMNDKMNRNNLSLLKSKDVLKFVVQDDKDLDDMKDIIKCVDCNIFVSPIFGKINPKDIVQYLKDNNIQNVRLQLQLHKIVYDPEQRGV